MKQYILAVMISFMLLTLISCDGSYVVTSTPAQPYYVRPASPGIGYVWIDGDWRYYRHNYVWHEGYWAMPRANRTWHGGNWQPRRNGYAWHRRRWH